MLAGPPALSLVPTVRLELTRLSPPPPQDGVSTNSTTSANGADSTSTRGSTMLTAPWSPRKLNSLRNVACLAARWCGDIFGRVLCGVLGRILRNGAHDAAAFILRYTMAGSAVRKSDRGEKKHRRQHGRAAREEVGRSRCAEQTARSATSERRSHVC